MTEPEPTPDRGGEAARAIDWGAALATHARWLRTTVLARLGERQAVDEVLQEVALAAVAQDAPLGDPSKLSAWLHRLAVRQALLYRRKQGRRRKINRSYALRNGDDPAGSQAYDPLGWLLLDERRRLVREAIARLPARDAEILLLKYTEDWSCRELAAHLGLSTSAVEARLHRARHRLRGAMASSPWIEVPE